VNSKRTTIVIAAVAIVALGAIGLAAGTGSDSAAPLSAVTESYDGAGDDAYVDVMTSIEQAIGKTAPNTAAPMPAPMPTVTKGSAGGGIAAAPPFDASRNSAGDSGALIRPDQPVTGPIDPLAYGANASAAADDRKIVQTASLRLQVKEVGGGFEEVGRIASAAGGFVASSSFSYQGEQQVASVTIRVPTDRYQDVLRDLRGLGEKVDTEASNASDVTEEYTDLAARQRNLEATEQQLLTLLGQARNVNEILQVQDRLNSTRGEIERVKGRMALLDKLTALSTITVHLRPVVPAANGPSTGLGEAVRDAWQDSLDFLGSVATGVIGVIVFGWWVPVLVVPGWVIANRWLRSRPRPVTPPLEGV
jgi:hypothetical protein